MKFEIKELKDEKKLKDIENRENERIESLKEEFRKQELKLMDNIYVQKECIKEYISKDAPFEFLLEQNRELFYMEQELNKKWIEFCKDNIKK